MPPIGNNIKIRLETLIYLVVLVVGIAGSFFTLKASFDARLSKIEKELEQANVLVLAARIENIENGIEQLQLSVSALVQHLLNRAGDNPG